MSDMSSKAINRDLVISILQKIYWLEAHMEELLLWETSIESGGTAKQALDTLIMDSEKHKILVEKWFDKLEIKPPVSPPTGFPEKMFDFSGMEVPEMFKHILKYEILAKGLYENLLNLEKEQSLKSLIPDEKDRAEFLILVKDLIEAESRHMEICKGNMGSFRRIMGK